MEPSPREVLEKILGNVAFLLTSLNFCSVNQWENYERYKINGRGKPENYPNIMKNAREIKLAIFS